MGFFDRILKGKIFKGKYSAPPALVAELELEGEKYILTSYEMDFGQDVDRFGRPFGDVRGGIIKVTMEDILAARLNHWVMSNIKTRSGLIRLYKNVTQMSEGSQQVIVFENAYCTEMKKESGKEGEVVTSLVISPARIKIDEEDFVIR